MEELMKRIPRRFAVLTVCLLILNTAGLLWIRHGLLSQRDPATGPVRVVQTLPESNVDEAERIAIVFDRDVGEPARLNDVVANAMPFQFTPDVPGTWEWTTPRRVEFVLDNPLPAGRTFKVEPASGLESQLGRVVQVDAEIQFKTRPLKLTVCRLVSSDRSHVTFELKFNQQVSPQELISHLTVRASDEASGDEPTRRLAPESLVDEPAESIIVRCQRPRWNRVLLTVDEKLTGVDGERPLGESISRTLKMTPAFSFLRTEVRERGSGQWQVDVLFNSPLKTGQTLAPMNTTPKVDGLAARLAHSWRVNGQLLRLTGPFESGRRYQATLPASVLSAEGKPLGETETISFRIPDRRPNVTFPESHGILSQNGHLELQLETVNVSGVRLTASRVHANNLVTHLHGTSRRRTSRDLEERVLRIESKPNETAKQILNLRELLDKPLGVYRISASATDKTWTRDSALISVTDLGLTLKQSKKECVVWVTSLRTAKPVAGARVAAFSYNNQQLAEAQTDENGLARLSLDPRHPDGRAWVITAELDEQTAWLKTDEHHAVLDDVDQSGREHPNAWDVMLYSDRGTYRPGETIHLTGIARDEHGGVASGFPFSVHVTRPDGRKAETLTASPGESTSGKDGKPQEIEVLKTHGVFHHTFRTPESAWTGTWTFHVTLPGSATQLGRTQVFVEEFVPVRLEVEASPVEELKTDAGKPVVEIASRYLFGEPAAGLTARVHTWYVASRFHSSTFPDFHFGPLKLPGERPSEETQVKLDFQGKAKATVLAPPEHGVWRATSSVTVSEDGGRSVSTQTDFAVDRSSGHIGLRLSDAKGERIPSASTGEAVSLNWVQLAVRDQPAKFAPLKVELQRVDFEHVLQRVNGRTTWDSIERVTSIWTRSIDESSNGHAGTVPIRISEPGTFRLIATTQDGSRTEIQFPVSTGGRGLTRRMNRPERLDIQLNRTKYTPGETAEATITSPFGGTALVCVEADRVLSWQIIELEGTSATAEFDVPVSLRGGAFVSANLLRAIDPEEKTWLPHRAQGIARLNTDHKSSQTPIAIQAAARVDLKDELPIAVTTSPGTLIHLWAVDEGILATSGFPTPDPLKHFFAPRKNDVISSDVFSRLLPDHQRPAALHRIGGGGDAGGVGTLRRNPVPAKRPRPVVIWSGFFKADEGGQVETIARLSQRFTGRLRWMAVAVNSDRYSGASSRTVVTQPLLVEASWPRYVSAGDSFSVPVKLINTTDQPVRVTPDFATDGLILLDEVDASFTGEIPPRGTKLVWQHLTATDDPGVAQASLDLKAEFLDADSRETTGTYEAPDWCRLGYDIELSVRPVTAIETERQLVSVDAGQEKSIAIDPKFLPQGTRTKVTLSSTAATDLVPAFESLMDYPYGCVEQTSSRLRSLFAAGHVLSLRRADSIQPFVDAGISRLWSLQLRSGALSYWPGQSHAANWGTAYATETLLLAKEHGHEVDDRLLTSLQRYLETALNNTGETQFATKATICCCLSRLGKPPTGWMAILNEDLTELDMAARSQLALAWWHAGRREEALAALPPETIDLATTRAYGSRPRSGVTSQARLLAALVEIDPDHKWIPILVDRLQKARKNGVWLSTLENALVLESLAAWQKTGGGTDPFIGKVTIGGELLELARGQSHELTLDQLLNSIPIRATGKGRVSLCVQTTGLTQNPPKETDQLIQVRRKWLTRDGRSLDPQKIRIGDLIIAEVHLKSLGKSHIQNVAIVDSLPGGLEIENPRLRTSDQTLESAPADHVQFLDDRVVLFATARPRETVFRFALRAVAAGSFAVPPIQASCMYNESIRSIHGTGQRVRVKAEAEDRGPLAAKPEAVKK